MSIPHPATSSWNIWNHRKHRNPTFPKKPLVNAYKTYKTRIRWFPFEKTLWIWFPYLSLFCLDAMFQKLTLGLMGQECSKMFRFWDQNLTTWKVQIDLKLLHTRTQMSSDHQVSPCLSKSLSDLFGGYVQIHFSHTNSNNYEILRIANIWVFHLTPWEKDLQNLGPKCHTRTSKWQLAARSLRPTALGS